GRPDYGPRANEFWKSLTRRVGLPSVGAKVDKLMEINDRILWDKIIPSLQMFTYTTRMRDWVESTGGKFSPGTPEYLAQARRVADFANTVAGRVPQELVNPNLARGMRLLLFSPQWTMTRLGLTVHAAGDLSE